MIYNHNLGGEDMHKVLFVCVHNSGRSQIAEAIMNKEGKGEFVAESAGFEPGELNPLVVQVLQEDEGIDISGATCDSVFDFYKNDHRYHYIITVCDEGLHERCPIFPGVRERIHWSLEDPSTFTGSDEEKKQKIRAIKESVKAKTHELMNLIRDGKLKENAPDDWLLGKKLNA